MVMSGAVVMFVVVAVVVRCGQRLMVVGGSGVEER